MADYTADQRKQMAAKGWALDDGRYPIGNLDDLKSAIALRGKIDAGHKDALRALIIKRAKQLGHPELIPDDYKTSSSSTSTHAEPAGGLVTIPDVEILREGNWHSGLSGRVPVTAEDLDAMVQAATDAEVDQAPLKIGHVDPRFDGEPALGWLTNIRRNGTSLVADIADAPAKMAELIQSAFRRRSAEIAWGVKTPSGKTYKAALAGLALLGVTPPAVKGLADVVSRYSGAESDHVDRVTVIDGDDSELAELHASYLSAEAAYNARRVFLADGSRDTQPTVPEAAGNGSTTGQGDPVALTDDQVREQLGLPADMPVTDKLREGAELLNQSAANNPPEGQQPPAPAEPPTAPAAPATPPPVTPPAAGLAGAPLVSVDSAAYAQLQAQAAAGAEALRRLEADEREKDLQSALLSGRITPATRDQWARLWDTDKVQTKALLAGLPQQMSTVTNFSGRTNAAGKPVDENGLTEDDWAALQRTLNL